MAYTPPPPITPVFGGTLIVPIYDAPYTLPVPVSQGGPVFINTSLTPVVTWDTQGYFAVSLQNSPGTMTQTNSYFNAIQLFPETYTGSSCPYLVNSGAYGAHGKFSASNGLLYALNSGLFGYAYYNECSLLTPFGSHNTFGCQFFYLGATDLWRPVGSTTEQAVGTFTAISPQANNGAIGIFGVAFQNSGTVSENNTYFGGVLMGRPNPILSSNAILSPQSSALYGSNPQLNGEHFVNCWYNQTVSSNFQGARLPISNMPNVLMSCYYDLTTQSCYHLFGYDPASSFNSMTGEFEPALTDIGAFLVPGVTFTGTSAQSAPTSLCGFGWFWQTSQNTGVVLTPQGETYYNLSFVGQSANARLALNGGYTSIMGDGYGNFWLVTYTLSNSSFYVGTGAAQLLEAPSFLPITTYPIPLPCINPCSFGNLLGAS